MSAVERYSAIAFDQSVPPQSTEAEMSTLGAMLLSDRAAREVSGAIRKKEFYVPAHRDIFEAITSLLERGRAVDLVTLRDELISRGKLDSVGGVEYLVQIAETVPSATNAPHYAAIVRDKALLRGLQIAGNDIDKLVYDTEKTPQEKIAAAAAMIAKLASFSSTVDPMAGIGEIQMAERIDGIKIGFPSLEKMIEGGGIAGGQISTFMAESGKGKTIVGSQVTDHILQGGGRACYVIYADLTPERWKRRLLKQRTGRSTPSEDLEASAAWREQLADLDDPFRDRPEKLMIYDARRSGETSTLEAVMSRIHAEHAVSPFRLVVHDYFQKIRSQSSQRSRNDDAAMVAQRLEEFAADLGNDCATVVLSQVTAGATGNHERYGPELRAASALSVEISREKASNDAQFIVRKNRYGDEYTVNGIEFDRTFLRYRDPMEYRS